MYGMVLTLERRDQQQPSNGDCGCLHWHMLDTGYHQHSSMPQPLRALCMQYIRATHRVLGKPKFSQADCYFDVNIYLRRIVRPPLMCVRRSSKLATSDMRVVTLITPGVSDRSTCSRLAVGGGGRYNGHACRSPPYPPTYLRLPYDPMLGLDVACITI